MSLTEQQAEDFWATADKNNDGDLTIQELDAALRAYAPAGDASYCPPTSKDVAFMFSAIDKDGDNKVSKAEFMKEMKKPKRSDTLCQLFKELDKNGDGSLSRDEVATLIRQSSYGKGADVDQVIDQVLKAADSNNDGKVSFEEFKKAL